MREDSKFSREEITTLAANPVRWANDRGNDEGEDWEEEEEEPVWTADQHGR